MLTNDIVSSEQLGAENLPNYVPVDPFFSTYIL